MLNPLRDPPLSALTDQRIAVPDIVVRHDAAARLFHDGRGAAIVVVCWGVIVTRPLSNPLLRRRFIQRVSNGSLTYDLLARVTIQAPLMTRAAARGLSQLNESCPAAMAATDATMGCRL